MKTFLLAALFLFICTRDVVFAQNKTLGVGITTPNPNAALHIESPTGNQGVIMPRLTTEQRSTMSSLLTAADQGLMLFDTDAKEYFVWDGTGWKSSSQFSITDPANTGDGLVVSTQGLGAAGRFTIRNSATYAHAVYGENNGDSTSAAVHGNHIGNGFGVFGKSAGTKFSSAAVYGEHVGTGDAAGAFRISNPASPYSALYGETNGSGPAVYGNQVGLGRGGQFQITNPSNTQAAIRSYTAGQGNAGFFTINNPENTNAVVLAESNGTGAAIEARNTGTGNGFAGSFHNTDSANNYPAIQASTAGAASGVRVMQTTGRGGGIDVFMQNVTSPGSGVHVDQGGQGHAGFFAVTNATSGAPSLKTVSNGSGAALEVDQANNGMAIQMINGGLKYSVANINNAGTITVVAAVYKLNTTGTYTLPTNVPEGTFCKVFNGDSSGANVTIDPVFVLGVQSTSTIGPGTLRDFIFLNGNWYENP